MRTKTIILGMVVAALSIISLNVSNAQTAEFPPVKILPAERDMIKLIFETETDQQVNVKFLDSKGMIARDRIKSKSFDGGFAKRYKVQRNMNDTFWIEVKSQELVVTYKVTGSKDGKWMPELESTAYQPVVASK
ncbi:MAG: hypothetical protein KDC99_08180 [Cyclobacteriaceae bacterium]|nr:hypothetical protein [Cyclobacteriaceae bacterium]